MIQQKEEEESIVVVFFVILAGVQSTESSFFFFFIPPPPSDNGFTPFLRPLFTLRRIESGNKKATAVLDMLGSAPPPPPPSADGRLMVCTIPESAGGEGFVIDFQPIDPLSSLANIMSKKSLFAAAALVVQAQEHDVD